MATSLGSSIDGSLRELCAQLTAERLQADIQVETLWGEPDVRLQVCRPGDVDVTVELMAPDPPAWSSPSWDAVRVERGYREVWRGPEGGCSLEEVHQFVQALLFLGAAQLAQTYLALG